MKPHYIAREPALAIPLVALLVNVLALSLVAAQLQGFNGRLNVSLQGTAKSEAARIVLSDSGVPSLNGSAMPTIDELEFHLSALASNRATVSVNVPQSIPAQRLSEVLQACNRAGFTDVALEVAPSGNKR